MVERGMEGGRSNAREHCRVVAVGVLVREKRSHGGDKESGATARDELK